MEIPHIETRWDYRLKRDDYSVNLYPHPTAISKVRYNVNIKMHFKCAVKVIKKKKIETLDPVFREMLQ